jgi:hypothetical protein
LNNASKNLYSYLKQLYLFKKQNWNLKVLFFISGAIYSLNLANLAGTFSGCLTFALSAVFLIKDLGLNKLDIN